MPATIRVFPKVKRVTHGQFDVSLGKIIFMKRSSPSVNHVMNNDTNNFNNRSPIFQPLSDRGFALGRRTMAAVIDQNTVH